MSENPRKKTNGYVHMGLSENRVYIPNEIAIFRMDNDHENHWVFWGTNHFQTNRYGYPLVMSK